MTDEVAVEGEPKTEDQAKPDKVQFNLDISDSGPCKKHLKVTIPETEIDRFLNREYSDLVKSAAVPGFRPGKAPRKLIEKRFRDDVAKTVKAQLIMQSLEQIGENAKLDPLNEPELDVEAIDIPEEGDLVFEFDIEVRPEFELPDYKGLRLNRPTHEFTDKDVDKEIERILRSRGTNKTKEGGAALGDVLVADVRFMQNGNVMREFEDLTLRVDDELIFRDGTIKNFAKSVEGVKEGDTREVKVQLASTVAQPELAGQEIDAILVIKEVQVVESKSKEDFMTELAMSDEGEFRDLVRTVLSNRLSYAQEQAVANQIMEKIVETASWELPQDLLRRQADRSIRRSIVELQDAGYSEEDIKPRINRLRQESFQNTAKSLKQQFVLQAIAEAEGIKIEQEDLEAEVERLAERVGESARRFRARVEKEGLWESIGMRALERKTIEKISGYSTFKDVEWQQEEETGAGVDESAVPEAPAPAEIAESSEAVEK